MKIHFLKPSSILFLLLSLVVGSCKKYEDGPRFSLRTKKARITGNWAIKKIEQGGVDYSSASMKPGIDYRMMIHKDGSFLEFGDSVIEGTWEFSGGKNYLTISERQPYNVKFSYKIRRLTNTELWLEIEGTGMVIKLAQ